MKTIHNILSDNKAKQSTKRNIDLAKEFNCDPSHIGKIKKGKARTDVI